VSEPGRRIVCKTARKSVSRNRWVRPGSGTHPNADPHRHRDGGPHQRPPDPRCRFCTPDSGRTGARDRRFSTATSGGSCCGYLRSGSPRRGRPLRIERPESRPRSQHAGRSIPSTPASLRRAHMHRQTVGPPGPPDDPVVVGIQQPPPRPMARIDSGNATTCDIPATAAWATPTASCRPKVPLAKDPQGQFRSIRRPRSPSPKRSDGRQDLSALERLPDQLFIGWTSRRGRRHQGGGAPAATATSPARRCGCARSA